MTAKPIRPLLVTMLFLQGLTLLGQWTGGPSLPAATAQIPDAGAQRNRANDELAALNDKMDRLIELLQSGKVRVTPVKPAAE